VIAIPAGSRDRQKNNPAAFVIPVLAVLRTSNMRQKNDNYVFKSINVTQGRESPFLICAKAVLTVL